MIFLLPVGLYHITSCPSNRGQIKTVFSTFLEKETIAQTAKCLNEEKRVKLPRKMRNGSSVRADLFRIDNTHGILKNKAYIGIKVFNTKDGFKEAQGAWENIIDPIQFDRVQKILKQNFKRKKPPTMSRYPYSLSGVIYCKTCGDRLCGKSANGTGGKIAYYEHAWSTRAQSGLSKKVFNCNPNRILAKKIEPVVWSDVKQFLQSASYAQIIFDEASAKYAGRDTYLKEIEKVKGKVASLRNQIEAVTERIAELPKGIDAKSFYDQILKLQDHKKAFEEQLQKLNSNKANQEDPIDFEDFMKFTIDLKSLMKKCNDPNDHASIIRKLVERIEVTPEGFIIHYFVGQTHYLRELGGNMKVREKILTPLIEDPKHISKSNKGLVDLTRPSSKPLLKYRSENSLVTSSNSLTIGADGRIRTSDHLIRSQVLYPAELRPHTSRHEELEYY